MPKGAIHVGESAKDYEFKIVHTHTPSSTTANSFAAESIGRITWGNAYVASTTGIEIKIDSTETTAGVWSYSVTVTSQWGTWTGSATISATSIDAVIQFDDLQLVVDGSCGWTLSFSEMRVYIKGTLKHTESATSISGSSFDRRLDCWYQSSASNVGHISVEPVCTLTYTAASTWNDQGGLVTTGGWKVWNGSSWDTDTVQISSPALPSNSCTCFPTGDEVSVIDSYSIMTKANYSDVGTKALDGTFTCPCEHGGSCTVQSWHRTRTVDSGNSHITAVPDTSGIFDHHWDAVVSCAASGTDELSSDSTETVTYCAFYWTETYEQDVTYCWQATGLCPCAAGPDGKPALDCSAHLPANTTCSTTETLTVTWPTLPPCSNPGGVSYDVSRGLIHWRGFLDSGEAWVGWADNQIAAWNDADTGQPGDAISLRIDRRARSETLSLLLEQSSAIFKYVSDDAGGSWTLSHSFGAGSKPAGVIGLDRIERVYWIDSGTVKAEFLDPAGNSVDGGSFTPSGLPSVDDQPLAVDESTLSGNTQRIVLWATVSGTLTSYVSTDGGRTFT